MVAPGSIQGWHPCVARQPSVVEPDWPRHPVRDHGCCAHATLCLGPHGCGNQCSLSLLFYMSFFLSLSDFLSMFIFLA